MGQELRDDTAFFHLRNVNTGHPGSIATIHVDGALAFEHGKAHDLGRDETRPVFMQLGRIGTVASARPRFINVWPGDRGYTNSADSACGGSAGSEVYSVHSKYFLV